MSFWQAALPPLEKGQRQLVPETVQISNMDCGPAALKSLLEGFGIPVNYGRLREACQTSVDGTSIDELETVANQLGLVAQQVLIPVDHLLLPEADALPAIAIVQLPSGLTHFIVIWRALDGQVQVMDPRIGRKWITDAQLQEQLFVHETPMDAAVWREWAGTDGFLDPLRARLTQLEVTPDALLAQAVADDTWQTLALLDAATRLVNSLVKARALAAGADATALIERFVIPAADDVDEAMTVGLTQIPAAYWFVHSADSQTLTVRGAVLVSVLGVRDSAEIDPSQSDTTTEIIDSINAPDPAPMWEIWQFLRQDGLFTPTVVALAASLAAIGVTIEALVLRGVLEASFLLTLRSQRITGVAIFLTFAALMIVLEFGLSAAAQRMGRHLDTRLRIAFLSKIPRLGDRYFRSRLVSDMTMRAHELAMVRQFPLLGVRFLRIGFQLLLTTIGVAVLIPSMLPVILIVLAVTLLPSLLMQSLLREQDLRLRTHSGGLSRFYLDGLLGLVAIQAHSAEKSIESAHEMLLTEWVRAGRSYNNAALWIQGVQAIVGTIASIAIVLRYLAVGNDPAGLLLLFYWVLSLPQLGQRFASVVLQYPQIRSRVLRLIEPLGAPDEAQPVAPSLPPATAPRGVAVTLEEVTVAAGGHPILEGINLAVAAGEHVAIVGASGAGKSTLVGLLLGWHQTTRGSLTVDGLPLDLDTLRRQTAWVDPSIQIWNEMLLDNLEYGNSAEVANRLNFVLDQANLYDVLEQLPDGLQTKLGEGGRLVAGGEGQRVRLGRAMLRKEARLVILDEPFRGLDRPQREALLAKARAHWADATLLFISHDVSDTQQFDRVVVLDSGRLVEEGIPTQLLAQPDSAYQRLLASPPRDLWRKFEWQRLTMQDGRVFRNTGSDAVDLEQTDSPSL